MTLEEQLLNKTYYTMFINDHDSIHPIQVLGEAFQEEAKKDLPDLAAIRFAQGEVYFHHRDFEAAIFKWGNITGSLDLWAKKNTADAYRELGMLSAAEDLYSVIETDEPTLHIEVALKLFSLYIQRGKLEAAVAKIKRTIGSHPDYPNVASIGREFFEEREDWENAVELAVNEAKRTESFEWFDILLGYVEKGVTKPFQPSYFLQVLLQLYSKDKQRFEKLVITIWDSYKQEDHYFTWLKEINYLLLNLEIHREDEWNELSKVYKETYLQFLTAGHFIRQLQEFTPDLLTNWLRLADKKNLVPAAAAVLSWNELFPASLSVSIVQEAEELISIAKTDMNELQECLTLYDSIIQWAAEHDMGHHLRMKWTAGQLTDYSSRHLLVLGLGGSGKSTFINTILGEHLQDSPTSTVVVFKNGEDWAISEVTDEEVTQLPEFADFQERMDRMRNASGSLIEFAYPSGFLKENSLVVFDTPGLKGTHQDRNELMRNLHLADTILFVLDANVPITDKERGILAQIQELAPDIPIHFVISKMDTIPNEQEAIQVLEETKSLIHSLLPDAKILAYSSQYDRSQQIKDLEIFINEIATVRNLEDKRLAKLLFFIRSTLAGMLQKRLDAENYLVEAVRWNEEMHQKLTGAVNQLNDTISQKTKTIQQIYRSIRESIEEEILTAVPKLLQDCSSFIKEDSDFAKIHLELNKEMNRRLQEFMDVQMIPKYYRKLKEWIEGSKEEFAQSQELLNELSTSFNSMFGEERLKLECDFKVLEDWQRDTDRMTARFQLENINVLLRRTPSQFLLKSAGKLLGALSQKKAMLYSKYKDFVENEDYLEASQEVSRQFFRPFELFESSIERDVSLFFKSPLNILKQTTEEVWKEIEANREKLNEMNTNPEMFRDPLTLFEVRLRQFEWTTIAGRGMQNVY